MYVLKFDKLKNNQNVCYQVQMIHQLQEDNDVKVIGKVTVTSRLNTSSLLYMGLPLIVSKHSCTVAYHVYFNTIYL